MNAKHIADIAAGLNLDRSEASPRPAASQSGDCSSDCSVCGGVGYIRYEVPLGHPKFGKLERCPHARELAIKKSLQGEPFDARIGLAADELHHLNWSLVKNGVNQADRAGDIVRRACQAGHGLVFLYGGFGQGKSLALKIATAMALKAGKHAAYANLAGVMDDIRLAYDERENKMTELVRRVDWWTSLDVLAIDELDKAGQTDWARERIFQLLDVRYQRAIRQEALTVIASNHESLDELSGYLKSRIEDNRFAANGYILHLKGADGRKSMPRNWKY